MITSPLRTLRSHRGLTVLVVFGLAIVYLAPYHFPVHPCISEAYAAGFNVRALVALFLLFAASFAWLSKGLGVAVPRDTEARNRPSGLALFAVLGFFALLQLLEWHYARQHVALNEATYFLDRLQHLFAREKPYTQFEFSYGPIMLYVPLAIAKLGHVSMADGYYAAWLLEYLLGIVVLWRCVWLLPVDPKRRTLFFLLASSCFWTFHLSLGEQYTPLRFLLAPWLAMELYTGVAAAQIPFRSVALLLAGEVGLLLFSPEQGVAFVGGSVLMLAFGWFRSRSVRNAVALGATAVCSLILMRLADNKGLFLTAHNMAKGGYNLPFAPHSTHVAILALLLTGACLLRNDLMSGGPLSKASYLLLINLFLIPAAFGRSDPGHLLLNTTPAWLAVGAALSHRMGWKRSVIFFMVFAVLVPGAIVIRIMMPVYKNNRKQEMLASLPPSAFTGIAASQRVFAPFQVPMLPAGEQLPWQVSTGYYAGWENVSEPEEVQQVVQEIAAARDRPLLVPEPLECSYRTNAGYLRRILGAPFVPRMRSEIDLLEPICEEIRKDFRPSAIPSPLLHFVVWVPNSESGR